MSCNVQNPTNAALIHDNANDRSCCRLANITNKHDPSHQKSDSVLYDALNKQRSDAVITKKGASALLVVKISFKRT